MVSALAWHPLHVRRLTSLDSVVSVYVALQPLCFAQPAIDVCVAAMFAPPQQFTRPPAYGTTGSFVPWNDMIGTGPGLHDGRYTVTATGATAANVFGWVHASNELIRPPSDMPVEYTRVRVDAERLLEIGEKCTDHLQIVLLIAGCGEGKVLDRPLAVGRDDHEVVAVGERLEVRVRHLLHRVGTEAVEVEHERHGLGAVVALRHVQLVRCGAFLGR